MRRCPRCKTEKTLDNFYNRRNSVGNSTYCKPCTTDQTVERQRALKEKAVEYKGGKCVKCTYDRCISALEFHHREGETKDFGLGEVKLTSWSEKIMQELDKCDLLCANCHREEHFRLNISARSSTG